MKKILLALFVLALGMSLTGVAYAAHGGAGHAGGALGVDTEILDSCSVSATSITFTGYIGFNVFANGSVDVRCTDGTSYVISLSAGGNYGSLVAGYRGIKDGATPANFAPYELYQSIGPTVEWGDDGATHPAASLPSILADGSLQSTTVYGVLWNYTPVPPAGDYRDAVIVTATY